MHGLRLVRVWSVRRLHHTARRWRSVLALILVLVGSIRGHLGIASALGWSHLLIVVAGLVRLLRHVLHAWAARRNQRVVAGIGDGARTIRVEWHVGRLAVVIGGCSAAGCVVATLLIVLIPVLGALVLAAPHAHVAADAHTTALLGHHAAQSRALRQTRELLRGKDGEGRRLHFGAVGHEVVAVEDDVWVLGVQVLDLAQVLEEREAEAVLALVADRQVREDEVASWGRAIEVGHASDGRASQDREAGRCGRRAARSNSAGILETGVQEEVRIVREGHLVVVLEDAQLDNRRRVDRTTISARLCAAAAGTSALWLLNDLQGVADLATVLGGADRRALGLVVDCNGGSHGWGCRVLCNESVSRRTAAVVVTMDDARRSLGGWILLLTSRPGMARTRTRLDHWRGWTGVVVSTNRRRLLRRSLVEAGGGAPDLLASQRRAVGIPRNVMMDRHEDSPGEDHDK